MVLNAGSLNRRIQVQRFDLEGTDGFGGSVGNWRDFGPLLFARRRDVSDVERYSSGKWENKLVARFITRISGISREIKRSDRLICEGIPFEIDGIKEVPGKSGFLEITAHTDALS